MNLINKIFPFLGWITKVDRYSLRADIGAGLTGAVISLPQGVAFAMIAGLPPVYGLYTAIVTPIIASLFGSSKHMVSGPATAISIVIFSALRQFAEPGSDAFILLAMVITLMAGVIQFAMGLARLGSVVNFVSHTVVIGFTAGAAVLIAAKQLQYCTGIDVPHGSQFYEILDYIFNHLSESNGQVLIVSSSTFVFAVLLKKFSRKLPNLLLAMIGGSLLSYFLGGDSVGIKLLGEIDVTLPPFQIPSMTVENVTQMIPNAFAIALLGVIEAVAIAKAIATKTGQKIDANQEFIGQGLSNIVGSFFNCYAGSGSFTRSGVNFEAGAKTPWGSIFAAIFLGIILLFVGPLAAFLPIPAMGGIILLVGYNLIDFKHIKKIAIISGREFAVLLITFLATLFLHLEFAIYLGVIFSLIFYLLKTSKPRVVPLGIFSAEDGNKSIESTIRKEESIELEGMTIIRMDGSMYFGSVEHIDNIFAEFYLDNNKFLIIDGSGISTIDMSGADLLVKEAKKLESIGGGLYLYGLKKPVREYLARGEYIQDLRLGHIVDTGWEAIESVQHAIKEDSSKHS